MLPSAEVRDASVLVGLSQCLRTVVLAHILLLYVSSLLACCIRHTISQSVPVQLIKDMPCLHLMRLSRQIHSGRKMGWSTCRTTERSGVSRAS